MDPKPGVSYVHIDSTAIQQLCQGKRTPILAVMKDGTIRTGFRLRIEGPSEVVYAIDAPKMLLGKYHTWIETESEVVIDE